MEKEFARARAKLCNDMEGIDLKIGKDTEVFLPKFEDNEVALPNVTKGVALQKTNLRQPGYRTLYPEVKFQSAIYPSCSNAYDQHCGCSYQFCDTDPEKVGSQSREEPTLENQNEDRSTNRRSQQKSVRENNNAAKIGSGAISTTS